MKRSTATFPEALPGSITTLCQLMLFCGLVATGIVRAESLPGTDRDTLIRVAIYDHSDGSANGPKNLKRILVRDAGFDAVRVTPEEIQKGILEKFDVLIMPGGSGSKQAEKLGEEGRAVVKSFVRSGGGYVGICAGSYLASSQYTWSLGIVNARVWDRSHWARGTGTVSLGLSPSGRKVLKSKASELDVYYGQGPLLIPHDNPELPGYEVLATYETEIAKKGAPVGAMVGTHAIVRTMFHDGRVLCFSPHPESSGGPNSIMVEGIRWAGSKPRN
ncbi:BPL-N domain-containing protein [Rosistilla oblonga]|uniref:BPL-N domain-containing protein n=1 Tax=Rosistilla oblonga TaxID=2527990 RepID=UPI003A9855E5